MVGGARAIARCDTLGIAPYSDSETGLFRAYLTPAHAAALEAIGGWMREAGMSVRRDAMANLIGRYEAAAPGVPALLVGSHIDSVRDAGRYDGPLGIMLGIELVARLHATGRRLPFAIEVVAFGDEEGSRFPASMLCSRAVAGMLEAEALEVQDREGVTVGDALQAFPHFSPLTEEFLPAHPEEALSVVEMPSRRTGNAGSVLRDAASTGSAAPQHERFEFFGSAGEADNRRRILAFIEPHIEQGPVLEADGLAVGVVTGIAAQLRYQVTVTGTAGHAGTTAMRLRRDALAAAAEMIVTVERTALAAGGDVVATVGRIAAAPGAVNVIPGTVEFSIDVRAGEASARDEAAADIVDALADIADRRGVELLIDRVQDLPAAPCDPKLMALMDRALAATGQPPRRLVSGAGHDTMVMAALCPVVMLFLRSPGGISHNPAESVIEGDVEIALDVLAAFVDLLEEDFLA